MLTRTKLVIGALGAGLVLAVWGTAGVVQGGTSHDHPRPHISQPVSAAGSPVDPLQDLAQLKREIARRMAEQAQRR